MTIPTPQELRANLRANDYDYKVMTDQKRGLPRPGSTKPANPDGELIELPAPLSCRLRHDSLVRAMSERASRRQYLDSSMTLAELSFLLYFTQGVRGTKPEKNVLLRTVPSAGARHTFETYLACMNVEGLKRGIYRYLPLSHQLVLVREYGEALPSAVAAASLPVFSEKCAVMFIWSTLPYRSEWRYPTHAHKVILIDAGHVCQNLYLACEALGCGTCAIGAYDQKLADELCGLDGEEEFVIYMSSVGRV